MIKIRKSSERGYFNFGWLETRHTFSFGDYHDPEHMGYRDLRVINEDIVKPAHGFPTHSHHDMEIITYVLKGALKHKDSMDTSSIIEPGDIQRMSAGSGVRHSEFNHSQHDAVHLLQIWILPDKKGMPPSYEQVFVPADKKQDQLYLVASREGGRHAVKIHQDVLIYASLLSKGKTLTYEPAKGRGLWLQMIEGALDLNGKKLSQGDAAAIENEKITVKALQNSHFLLFDLA